MLELFFLLFCADQSRDPLNCFNADGSVDHARAERTIDALLRWGERDFHSKKGSIGSTTSISQFYKTNTPEGRRKFREAFVGLYNKIPEDQQILLGAANSVLDKLTNYYKIR